MKAKEKIFNRVATRLMKDWDIDTFKTSQKRLFDVIMESMDAHQGQLQTELKEAKEMIDTLNKELKQRIETDKNF